MDARISMYVLLVCVWCSLDAGGLLMVVTAQSTVSVVILTPEADRKEGGQVYMSCVATNLQLDHIVSWTTEEPYKLLRLGDVTMTTESRFSFTQVDTTTVTTVQYFTIANVQREDSDEYFCKVDIRNQDGTYSNVASSSVTFSVLYFPNASFPICSPAGPITVDNGTVLNMRCTSESGHRTVTMIPNPTIHTTRYTVWTSQIIDEIDTLIRTSDLTADVADDGIAIDCIITSMYYPKMERPCTIGPITINHPTSEPKTSRTLSTLLTSESSEFQTVTSQTLSTPTTQSCPPMTDSLSSSTPWILAFVVAIVIASASFIINITLIICIIRKNRLNTSFSAEKESQSRKPDPYMELQPTEDKNRVYMEPTTATTTTQDTYYQPVEVENDSPEYDYARPEGSTNTSYEAVRKPQSCDRPYQNINH